ncbi:hypothetical protein [Lonsdalea quercina]|uniref:hypothetical protein n=1 Tax=Lonsdalea quercina TaxID=71657 RepID=UPI0039749CEA
MKIQKITPISVERDENGYWTHPGYTSYFDDREYIPEGEFYHVLKEIGIEADVTYLEYDDESPVQRRYFEGSDPDVHDWEPPKPCGDGWFIVSIHDTEDGPACVWMRSM